jgi:hypothetical protein
MCAGKVMGPGGEAIKALGERSGCSVVVESKNPNAAFVPFRLVNYLAPGTAEVAAAVAEVAQLVCQEEKYEGAIRELNSVCFRIVEIPERRVGALLGPSGAHIKSLQEVLRCKMGVADSTSKPGSRFVRCVPRCAERAGAGRWGSTPSDCCCCCCSCWLSQRGAGQRPGWGIFLCATPPPHTRRFPPPSSLLPAASGAPP